MTYDSVYDGSFAVGDIVYFDEAQGVIEELFLDIHPACARVRYANGYVSDGCWLSDLMTESEYEDYEKEMQEA